MKPSRLLAFVILSVMSVWPAAFSPQSGQDSRSAGAGRLQTAAVLSQIACESLTNARLQPAEPPLVGGSTNAEGYIASFGAFSLANSQGKALFLARSIPYARFKDVTIQYDANFYGTFIGEGSRYKLIGPNGTVVRYFWFSDRDYFVWPGSLFRQRRLVVTDDSFIILSDVCANYSTAG
jgi:hypothetical protein